jgi:two-component system CheB/CheR fusion protein
MSLETPQASNPTTQRPAHVVGIGASAGGLEALERFFDNLPANTGMAFVIVQHLSPDFKSLMDELLSRHTDLPIHLVEDGMPVERDHVYLIPPKKEMIISGGRLLLSERDRQQELTLPIDVFFRSLAQDCGPRAIAIVLSGGGTDGSRGVRAVHEAGGMVVVQDDASAQFSGMPKTARDTNVASWVLAPEEMPKVIAKHALDEAASTRSSEKREPTGLDAVYDMLQREFGIDFTHYKPSTVTRRIERRLKLSRADDIATYVERLKHERSELDTLYRDLLIGVTRFFRNEEAFKLLETKVLPEIARNKEKGAPLRVWIAGCATGEEAYSVAILLHELAAREGNRQVKVFATDVHRGSLEVAARGVYDEESVANVSNERLERYFMRHGKNFQVVGDLRQSIVFAAHDVIRDAPFTRLDLVTCRNLLIYLQPPAQQRVLSNFHFALSRGGVVFLGPSETLGLLAPDFETVDRHWHVYRKYSDVRIPVDTRLAPTRTATPPRTEAPPGTSRASLPGLLGTYDKLLEEFMPPGLLVTERGEIVHSFGGASKHLKLRDGRPVLDIRDMLDDELKVVVGGGLQRALKSDSAIVFRGIRLGDDGAEYKVSIRRVRSTNVGGAHVLITFSESQGAPSVQRPETEMGLEQVSRDQIGVLENELSLTKENLQAAIEELETSNEELQAANEELLASNEELQSTNEELQSVNEELYTVNAEYQRKITELTELTNDMDNLLSSTDVGSIFLDRQLRIRRFTPQIAEAFNLLPLDIGRPIQTFASNIDHPELTADLERVLETGQTVEREIRDKTHHAFFLRILPYKAKGTIDGVVLTMIDVSGLKAAEDALFHERYLLNSLLETTPDAIYFKDLRGRFIRANHAMASRLGIGDPRDAVGKTPFELGSRDDVRDEISELHTADESVLRSGTPQRYVLEKRTRTDGVAWDVATRLPLRDVDDKMVGLFAVLRDVTEQRLADEKIQDAIRRRDQFLAMLSHELRNPLGAVVTAAALLADGKSTADGAKRLLSILQRQSTQMARLLDDLLEASRVTQNKIELRRKLVDVRGVAKDAADAVRPLLEARNIELAMDLDSRPLWVDGDPTRLQQIQVNLLNNAAKYTPKGGHVKLSATREDDNAVIRVADDGVGIPKELLENIFELFVQSKRTLDRSEGGIGVGLTLVRSLVSLHGGDVVAESDGIGKGAVLTVRLPLTKAEDMDDPVQSRERAKAIPKDARIVVVEDNIDSCAMLCEVLSMSGFDCVSSHDGRTGLDLITTTKPHAAIVDVGLPGLDGFEVARRLRQEAATRDMFLVALTGYGQAADRSRALESGFDEHIVKPVHPTKLLRILGREEGLRPSEPPATSDSYPTDVSAED